MICVQTVLPRFKRYSKSRARGVHPSMLAVQNGDISNRVESSVNTGLQLGPYDFNRTLVTKTTYALIDWDAQRNVDELFEGFPVA